MSLSVFIFKSWTNIEKAEFEKGETFATSLLVQLNLQQW